AGCGVVENEQAWILEERARQRHALLLAAGERHPLFADQGAIAIREAQDHVVDGGGARGGLHFGVRDLPADAIDDVVANGA
ncbi:hypothetical protein RZS08_24090, partial [Arthrospira platensis SPKY1]|nr:hypothetical protein [Arthrospira platensis SPKY1]